MLGQLVCHAYIKIRLVVGKCTVDNVIYQNSFTQKCTVVFWQHFVLVSL